MDIKDWITHISIPRSELGGFSVCPYAKGADYKIIKTDGTDINPPQDFELIVYMLPDKYTIDDVTNIASKYNNIYPELVFLPDPKSQETFINGVQTNNGKYNLILCQRRGDLEKSRKSLQKTNYYTYWSADYLAKILGS